MTTRDQAFITQTRNFAKNITDGTNGLIELQAIWNARGYSVTPPEDGLGQNQGFLAADIGPAIFDAANALLALLQSPVGGNLTKLL